MDYVSSDYDGVLDSAEEIKIITSCLQRIPSLQNVPYKINRDEKNGKVTLSISFLSDEIGVADIERFQKLLTRDIFEHCVNYEYQICIGENQEQGGDFHTSCDHLIKHIKTQLLNNLSLYMRFIDVELRPTILGRLEKGLLGASSYSLTLRIKATYPNSSYLLPEEEIEMAQKKCMEHIEGLHSIAAKYVRKVSIVTV